MKNSILNVFSEVLKIEMITAEKKRVETEINRALAHAYFYAQNSVGSKNVSESALREAQKMHLSSCVLDFCRYARYHYSVVAPNKRKVSYFNKIIAKHKKIREVEEEMDDIYSEFALTFNSTRSLKEKNTFIERTESLMKQQQNYQICIRGYAILAACFAGDQHKLLSYSRQALSYFESIRFYARKPRVVFAGLAIPPLIELEKYDEAMKLIRRYKPKEKNPNHFNYSMYQAVIMLREGRYFECEPFLYSLSLYGASVAFKQHWEILKAYLHALSEINEVRLTKNFKFGKFMNSVGVWASDKKGSNLNLVVLEVLFGYARNDSRLFDRTSVFYPICFTNTRKTNPGSITLYWD